VTSRSAVMRCSLTIAVRSESSFIQIISPPAMTRATLSHSRPMSGLIVSNALSEHLSFCQIIASA
jgi:hypothetical protein